MSLKTDNNCLLADIHPGVSSGPFRLGASLYSVLQLIRTNSRVFPTSHISFSVKHPINAPIIVDLPANGIRLQFDGKCQYLRLIEILEWGKTKLIYKNTELGRQSPINFRYIFNKVFGPTYPGQYVDTDRVYVLSYPGISFSFPIPADSGIEPNTSSEVFIKYLSQPSSPLCNSMAIFRGKSWFEVREFLFTDKKLSPATNIPAHEKNTLIEIDHAVCKIRTSDEVDNIVLLFLCHPDGLTEFNIILLKTTMQDIIVTLGPPDERLQKHDSRLSIHSPKETKKNRTNVLFNYFRYGIDICFDTSFGMFRVNKVILHNNLPRSLQFQKYKRCRWILDKTKHYSSFKTVCDRLKVTHTDAILINGEIESPSSSVELVGNGVTLTDTADDWGQTELHAVDNIVFEVLTANDMISTVTFFATERKQRKERGK